MADIALMHRIKSVEDEIDDAKEQIKSTREALTGAVSTLPEARKVEELVTELKAARLSLKEAIADDLDCKELRDRLEEERYRLNDLKDILSHHLLEYRETTKSGYVEETDSKKVKPIIVTARLGKPEYHQEELFPAENMSLRSGKA